MRSTLLNVLLLIILVGCNGDGSVPTQTDDPIVEQGRRVYSQRCATCHTLTPDTVLIGPSLAGIATRAESRVVDLDARSYIELSILRPDATIVEGFLNAMPSDLAKKLTSDELNAIVVFLLTLE